MGCVFNTGVEEFQLETGASKHLVSALSRSSSKSANMSASY